MRSLVFIRGAIGLSFNSECVGGHLTTYLEMDKTMLHQEVI